MVLQEATTLIPSPARVLWHFGSTSSRYMSQVGGGAYMSQVGGGAYMSQVGGGAYVSQVGEVPT